MKFIRLSLSDRSGEDVVIPVEHIAYMTSRGPNSNVILTVPTPDCGRDGIIAVRQSLNEIGDLIMGRV